jgi:hypothetical protein
MKDRIDLARNDNFRHIICYLANAGGMRMRAARLVVDVLHINPKEALKFVDDVQRQWREQDPDGNQLKPLPASLIDHVKGEIK